MHEARDSQHTYHAHLWSNHWNGITAWHLGGAQLRTRSSPEQKRPADVSAGRWLHWFLRWVVRTRCFESMMLTPQTGSPLEGYPDLRYLLSRLRSLHRVSKMARGVYALPSQFKGCIKKGGSPSAYVIR